MTGPISALLRMRFAALRNRTVDLDRDSIAKAIVVVAGLGLIVGAGHQVAYRSFLFIDGFPAIGPILNERLLSVLFLVLLVMVGMSTAIISYATLYLAEETEFLLAHPAPPRLVFLLKVAESVAYSAWATLVLGLPALAAFGRARRAPAAFYLETAAALILFLVFCGLAGAAIMLAITELVRRWTWRRIAAVGILLIALPAWVFLRSFEFGAIRDDQSLQALDRFTAGLAAIRSPFFPGQWASSSVVAASLGQHGEVLFQGGLLLANTLIFLPLFALYGRFRYGSRWLIARGSTSADREDTGESAGPRPAIRVRFPRGPGGALLWKDSLLFARDPAQLSQFLLFVLLLAVYVVSLLRIPHDVFGLGWRLLLYFGNLGALSLILSSFTSRFLFPLPSLEGRAFWVVGLAPIAREYLVRQKARAGAAVILPVGAAAALAANLFLGFRGWPLAGAILDVLLIGACLVSLAAGLGAAYPNRTEDNPARIAVGLGGTLNFFASAASIVAVLAIEGVPYFLWKMEPPPGAVAAAHGAAFLFAAIVSAAALRLGMRAIRRMEF